jgi:hypothetical protein
VPDDDTYANHIDEPKWMTHMNLQLTTTFRDAMQTRC